MSLVWALSEGNKDENKFQALYNKYVNLMYYVAFDILKDDKKAEEAVQESFIKILRSIDKINDVFCHKTRCWVVYITRRVSLNSLKYEKRREHEPETEIDDSKYTSDTEYEIIRKMEVDKIVEGIKHVDESCGVIVLKYYYDYSDTRLANYFNISKDLVRKRIERCKKKLKNYLLTGKVK